MADAQRLQTILTDFQKRMRKNGVTNKAIWTAFTSLPTISPVQFTRRLNSYGITVTNREVSSLWKYVGIKTNSMNYDDFVKIMQASPSSISSSAKAANKRTPASNYNEDQYNDDYNYRGGTANAVARPRLGRKDNDQPVKKERISARPSTTATAANSKPHVKIDSRFMKQKRQDEMPKRPNLRNDMPDEDNFDDDDEGYGENLYNEYRKNPNDFEDDEENYEGNEGSVASSSKYSRGKESIDYEDNEGSVASSSKYSRGKESIDYEDNERSVASSKYSRGKESVNYEDDDADYTSYRSDKRSSQSKKSVPKSAKYSPPKRSNNSGIDDDILNQGTYDSADDNEENYYPNRNNDDEYDDDDEGSSQYSRKQQGRGKMPPFNEDDDYASQYSRKSQKSQRKTSQYADDDNDSNKNYGGNDDDDDDDFEDKRFSRNGSSKGSARKSQEPEIFSRIPSSNSPDSPNRNPQGGGRRNLDPMIFGTRNVSSATPKSSRSSLPDQTLDQENDEAFKGAEKVSGIALKKLVSLISEKVYSSYPNGKACYFKWRGIHNAIEAEDIRNGLAKDSKVLISLEDANKIISKYGGPLTLSTFSRMLSDGTRFAEEEKSGQQELTNDEEAILKIAHSVKGNRWEDMIYRSPSVIDIVNGFADMGIVVSEDDIRVLTQKIGKTGLVNAIKANM